MDDEAPNLTRARTTSISDLMRTLNTKGPGAATNRATIVMDPRLLAESGGDLLLVKLPSPHKLLQLNFAPCMFSSIDAGSLLLVDNVLLENLRDATGRAVEDSSF